MHEDTSTPAVLGALRITLHVSFAALLLLGIVRAVLQAHASGTGARPLTLILGLAVLLAAVYLVTTMSQGRARRRGSHPTWRRAALFSAIVPTR